MLQEISIHIPQEGYTGQGSLLRIEEINREDIEGRFSLILELLKYTNALNLKLIDGNELYSPKLFNDLLGRAKTFSHDNFIIGSIFSNMLTMLTFEITEKNNTLDYTLIPQLLKGNKKIYEFIEIKVEKTSYSNPYSLIGKSGEVFNGKSFIDLSKLKGEKYLDILQGEGKFDEIKFIEDNKKLVLTKFNNIRLAQYDIIKCIISGEESVVNKLMREQI